jgi:hypothetical protein
MVQLANHRNFSSTNTATSDLKSGCQTSSTRESENSYSWTMKLKLQCLLHSFNMYNFLPQILPDHMASFLSIKKKWILLSYKLSRKMYKMRNKNTEKACPMHICLFTHKCACMHTRTHAHTHTK